MRAEQTKIPSSENTTRGCVPASALTPLQAAAPSDDHPAP